MASGAPQFARAIGAGLLAAMSLLGTGSAAGRVPAPFAERLVSTSLEARPGSNVLLSPLSIGYALSATSQLADGRTATEFESVLGIPVRTRPGDAADDLRRIMEAAIADGVGRLEGAVWLREDLNDRLLPAARQALANLRSDARPLPAGPGADVAAINDWVRDATQGHIPAIVDQVADGGIVVVNALYFKGAWRSPFRVSDTVSRPFFAAGDAKHAMVAMMHRRAGAVAYWSDGDLEAIRLPFERGGLEYVVVVSRSRAHAAQVFEALRPHWSELLDGSAFVERAGIIELPRQKLDVGTELSGALRSLGLASAFSPCADFSAGFREPTASDAALRLTQIAHRAVLSIDETGAAVAAATAVLLSRAAHAPPKPGLKFTVDRPYVAFLVHPALPDWPVLVAAVETP